MEGNPLEASSRRSDDASSESPKGRFVRRVPKRYDCYFFRQRAKSPVQSTFVATTADISDWSSVPQKAANELRNFQRPEIPTHVNEIAEFFRNSDTNSSPSAIVVGFKQPMRCFGRDGAQLNLTDIPHGTSVPGQIEIPVVEIREATSVGDKREVLRELLALLDQSEAAQSASGEGGVQK